MQLCYGLRRYAQHMHAIIIMIKKTDAIQSKSQVIASHHKYQVHFVIQCLYPKLCNFYPSLPGNKFSS